MTNLEKKYMNYLKSLVFEDSEYDPENYIQLFNLLRNTQFDALLEMDENRIADALEMRAEFEHSEGYYTPKIMDPISVLEVMVALAVRCEDSIMGNPEYGNRTHKWFWYMVKSLGLLNETDDNFDEAYCLEIIFGLISRQYSRDGNGGLFYIPSCNCDLRNIEIWYQMNWWLDTIGD